MVAGSKARTGFAVGAPALGLVGVTLAVNPVERNKVVFGVVAVMQFLRDLGYALAFGLLTTQTQQ